MKIAFFLFSIIVFLYPNENIKRSYTFVDDGIYMNDIFPNKQRVKLFDIKSNMSRFNIRAFSLIKKLRESNISIGNIDKISSVSFTRKSNFDDRIIKDFLKEKFLEKYEDIEIQNIEIKSLRNINMTNMLVKEIQIAPYALSRNTGSFKAIFVFNEKEKTIFYNFKITASLSGVRLTKDISREEELNSLNTENIRIALSKVNKPINSIPPYTVSARNLKKNHILTKFDIKKEYLVRKNAHIQVKLNLDGIEIISYFEAMENGYMNENIKIKNTSSGKIRVAKVIGKSKVSIR